LYKVHEAPRGILKARTGASSVGISQSPVHAVKREVAARPNVGTLHYYMGLRRLVARPN
jgi:hypothetical protein